MRGMGSARKDLSSIQESPESGSSGPRSRTKLETGELKQELDRFTVIRVQENEDHSRRPSRFSCSSRTREELEIVKQELLDMKESKAVKDRRLSYLERRIDDARSARKEELRIVIRKASALDLAFLVDATLSMSQCIDLMKNEIATIATGIAEKHPLSNLRVAFASYRDYDDEPYKSCDFTSSFDGRDSKFVSALAEVRASGAGRDIAEDVFSGLEEVAKLSWSAINRVLIHIGDAPCHGRHFHAGVQDRYPEGDVRNRDIGRLLRILRDDCKISCYTFCHLNESTHKMFREFQSAVGERGQSSWMHQETFGNIRHIPSKVVAVSQETIASTLSALARPGADCKYIFREVDATVPSSWSEIVRQKANQHRAKWYQKLDELLEKISVRHNLELEKMPCLYVQIAPSPFSADGALRWPFHAKVTNVETNKTFPTVVKRFKEPANEKDARLHSEDRYLEQMEVQTVSAQMAVEFNWRMRHLAGAKQVTFPMVTTLEVHDKYGQSKFYNMEKYLNGTWIKYSNNAGYVNTADFAATLQAFTHWTHERSRGMLMVTDLQGVRVLGSGGDTEFWLCDPAIHCVDTLRFTRTNLGLTGFQLFYGSHKCNDVCRNLKLKPSENGYTSKGTVLG